MVSLSSNALCDTTFAFCWRELLNTCWTSELPVRCIFGRHPTWLSRTMYAPQNMTAPTSFAWETELGGGEGGRDVPGRACHSVPTGGPQRFKIVVTLTHTVWLRPTKFGRTFDIRGVDCRMWDLCILWVLRYLTYAQTVWQRRNLARHGNTARDRFQR